MSSTSSVINSRELQELGLYSVITDNEKGKDLGVMNSGTKRKYFRLAVFSLVILLGLGGVAYGFTAKTGTSANTNASQDLPLVGSLENLISLLKEAENRGLYRYGMKEATLDGVAQATDESKQITDYSQTNTQVQGVDEGDLIKTDGRYIYQVNDGCVQIISAVPAAKMRVVNTIKFSDANFTPADLYLDGDKLIVIGNSYQNIPADDYYRIQSSPQIRPPYPPHNYSLCRAVVYNIKDKNNITQIRRLELEGNYLSSRKVGSAFYLLSNCHINYYALEHGQAATPLCRDTVKDERLIAQDIKTIRYFPGCIYPNYLVVGSIDLKLPQQAADIKTYLGSGETVYASAQNLYVAVSDYNYRPHPNPRLENKIIAPRTSQTKVYKFGWHGSKLVYAGEGQVAGTVLNQFSMDEHRGYFRIATTSEDHANDSSISRNNVYILDKNLQPVGQIENIAPGERIYATRFMGNRAYMVTFKNVDPFFVLDLKDPAQPKILGKLKIPGYSDYLHPYDENHIIGFGKDTVEASGFNGQSMAYYQGMKIAIFDVTDVSKPVEMSKVIIGDRGTDSELLRNHKALLFSQEKNMLAFPVTVMTIDKSQIHPGQNIPAYGSFTFQGAYIYNVDLQNGLQFKGKISHLKADDYQKAGHYWNDPAKSIARIMYIGNTVYTLSPDMIKANQMDTLREIKALPLK